MNAADLFSYVVTVVAIALAPGPAALVILVRAASKDVIGASGCGIGFALGGLIIITAVCFGLGAMTSTVPVFFEYSKYLMLAYMLWLARGIWKGGFDMQKGEGVKKSSLLGAIGTGLTTCFVSPYMMILFPLVLPELLNLKNIQLPDFAIVGALTFLSLLVGCLMIVGFAAQISRLARSPLGMQRLNRSLAGLLALAGVAMTFA